VDAAPPEEQEKHADEDQGEAEADPEPEGAPVATEAEPGAERESDEPVGGEVTEHGSARVAGTAKGSGRDGLDAVEQLKGGASGKEHDGGADNGFVGSVDASDVARKDEKHNAHERHKRGAEKDGGVTGVAGVRGRATAESLTNAHGSGGGKAERNHIGEGHSVQGDLVPSLRDGAEASDEGGDQGEDADFGGKLNGGGKAERDELANAREVGLHGSLEKLGFVVRVVPEEIDDENEREVRARNGSGDAGAGDPVSPEAEFAEDQDVVAGEIDNIRSDERESDGANHVHALQRAADGEVKEERDKSCGERTHVRSGKDGDGASDAEALVVIRENPDGDGEKRRDGEAEVDSVDERAVAILAATRAKSLRDQGVEADEDALAKEGEDDEEAGADANRADGLGTVGESADHHGVDDHHAHPPDFGEDEGKGEVEGGAKFAAEDREEGGHGRIKKDNR